LIRFRVPVPPKTKKPPRKLSSRTFSQPARWLEYTSQIKPKPTTPAMTAAKMRSRMRAQGVSLFQTGIASNVCVQEKSGRAARDPVTVMLWHR
jgi:hypothetical protein